MSWAVNGGTVTPAAGVTDANGNTATNWDLPTATGDYTVTASASEAENSPITFQATANPGPANEMLKGEGDGQAGPVNTPLSEALRVSIIDAFGNPIEGEQVTWTVESGTATLSPMSTATSSIGEATTMVVLGPNPGSVTVSAAPRAPLIGSPVVFTLTATP